MSSQDIHEVMGRGGPQVGRPAKTPPGKSGFEAKIVCCGPQGEDLEPDFDDARFWAEKVKATNTDPDEALTEVASGNIYTLIGEQSSKSGGQGSSYFVEGETGAQEMPSGTAEGEVVSLELDEDDHANDELVVRMVSDLLFVAGTAYAVTGQGGSMTPTDITSHDHVMITSKFDALAGTHTLTIGQMVDVVIIQDKTSPRVRRYYTTAMPWIVAFFFGGGFSAAGTIPVDGMAMILASRLTTFRSSPTQDDTMFFNRFAEFEGVIYGCGEATINSGAGDVAYTLVKWDEDAEEWVGVLIESGGPASLDAINDVIVWDDGGGDALYVCGVGVSNKPVWKFDGSTWVSLDFPVTGSHTGNVLKIWDDGGGEELYCGGFFIGATNEGSCLWNERIPKVMTWWWNRYDSMAVFTHIIILAWGVASPACNLN